MHSKLKKTRAIVMLICLAIPLLLGSCSVPHEDEFAIYLTRDDIKPNAMESLSHVELAGTPLISQDDILSYNAKTHEIALTNEAYKRFCELDIPVSGKSFLVCVNKNPLYWGAIWTMLSSQSFSGVVIMAKFDSSSNQPITIELGYPTEAFFSGQDPRSNPMAFDALDYAGKLVGRH